MNSYAKLHQLGIIVQNIAFKDVERYTKFTKCGVKLHLFLQCIMSLFLKYMLDA